MEISKLLLEKNIQELLNTLDKIEKSIPGVIIIHDIKKFNIIYMSSRGLKELNLNLEELCSLSGEEYHQKYFNPADVEDYLPKIKQLLANNSDESITFFQQVRTAKNMDWIWHISSMKILMRDKLNQPLLSITVSFPVDPSLSFTSKINRLLEENNFLKSNYHKFSKLTKAELNILKLYAKGKNIQEIANMLFVSTHTVETHRKNLKKKLETSSNYELWQYANAFDLI